MILAAGDGKTNKEIAAGVGTRPARVSKWRIRFARQGIKGLKDAPRTGAPRRYDRQTELRILAVLDDPPPDGQATWTGSLVAKRLGDVSRHQVWRVLRRHGICLQRRRSWCVSTDPEFARKAADIVGLYLDPPQDALVLCVDEKPHMQALERAQGWLRLPNGEALTGFNHHYKRHGTTTFFAVRCDRVEPSRARRGIAKKREGGENSGLLGPFEGLKTWYNQLEASTIGWISLLVKKARIGANLEARGEG